MLMTIKLQPNISCELICSKLQWAISNYQKTNNNNLEDSILVIDIKTPIDESPAIPNLEYKNIQT